MRFQGQVVVVTGAARGIGAEIAREFAGEGARVAALDIDDVRLKGFVAEMAGRGGEVAGQPADVTDAGSVRATMDTILARWGRVDVLVNNAGGFPAVKATEELADTEWDATLRLNLTSAFLCSRAILPVMKRQGRGRIVNLSSIGGRGAPVMLTSAYATTKAGILGFTRHLALEVAPFGITVNAVAPGTVATERFTALRTPEQTAALVQHVPLRRASAPAEIARCVLFLASEDAAYMTGACLDVNGGVLMV